MVKRQIERTCLSIGPVNRVLDTAACPGRTVEIPVHRQVVTVTDVDERFILPKMSEQYPARENMHIVFSS